MTIIEIMVFIFYAFFIGVLAKFFHPGEDPKSFASTVCIGVVGYFAGMGIGTLLNDFIHLPNFVWAVVGGVICCIAYKKYESYIDEDK